MDEPGSSTPRRVDRVTARVVNVVAVLFFLAGIGMVVRAVVDDRKPWLGTLVVAMAVTSWVRAGRHLT